MTARGACGCDAAVGKQLEKGGPLVVESLYDFYAAKCPPPPDGAALATFPDCPVDGVVDDPEGAAVNEFDTFDAPGGAGRAGGLGVGVMGAGDFINETSYPAKGGNASACTGAAGARRPFGWLAPLLPSCLPAAAPAPPASWQPLQECLGPIKTPPLFCQRLPPRAPLRLLLPSRPSQHCAQASAA